jgi:dTDP-glucose 4,6-dehydratase
MHLAAESHVDRSIDSPGEFIKTNINGTFNLLTVSRQYFSQLDSYKKKIFRFHHISTDEVYGDLNIKDPPAKESNKYLPSSPYSASKGAADHLVRAWFKTYGLPVIITNTSNNYGPFQYPEKLIPHTILAILHNKQIPIYGNGNQIRDWIFVEDHVEALLKVIKSGVLGETYNIGGNNQIKNIDVVKSICKIMSEILYKKKKVKNNIYKLITFVKDRPGHDFRYGIDQSKIIKNLNWKPKTNFKTGIKRTVLWYVNNHNWWKNIISKGYKLKRKGKKFTT